MMVKQLATQGFPELPGFFQRRGHGDPASAGLGTDSATDVTGPQSNAHTTDETRNPLWSAPSASTARGARAFSAPTQLIGYVPGQAPGHCNFDQGLWSRDPLLLLSG